MPGSALRMASSWSFALLMVLLTRTSVVQVPFIVRQPPKLVRNQRELWATTWTWDQEGYVGNIDRMLTDGTNAFLSKWLDVNGR